MTVFHLIRHGSYPVLGSDVLAGRTGGYSLDEEGRRQAEAVARALRGRPIDRVLAGPLERARESAAPLAAALGVPVVVDTALDELDFGDWTGRAWTTLRDDPAWIAWNTHRGSAAIPGGETIGAVTGRAMSLLRSLAAAPGADGEAALFTHADVIRAAVAAVLGLAPDLMLRVAIDPASRSVVRFGTDAPPLVLGVNLPPAEDPA